MITMINSDMVRSLARQAVRERRNYRQIYNISRPLVCNKLVDHVDIVGASPVGAAPTIFFIFDWTSGFSGLGKGSYKTRRETFKFLDLVPLILEVWRQFLCTSVSMTLLLNMCAMMSLHMHVYIYTWIWYKFWKHGFVFTTLLKGNWQGSCYFALFVCGEWPFWRGCLIFSVANFALAGFPLTNALDENLPSRH